LRTYEWKCPECGAITETASDTAPGHLHDAKGLGIGQEVVTFKRVYSFGVVWPKDKRGH